jgi:predicted RNase H-like nuclease (RuvC/YqgF family)
MMALSKEIERLNTVLERFSNENQDLKRKLYEAELLKSGINALEERLALASQENDSLRKSLNEKTQSQTKTSQ